MPAHVIVRFHMFLPRKSAFRRYSLPALLLFLLLLLAAWYSGWLSFGAYRLLLSIREPATQRLPLEQYRVGIEALPLTGITANASGLTYDSGRNSLFTVVNRPTQIVELTLEGRVKQIIPVQGVEDLEGITHMRGNEFILADERAQQVIHVAIDDAARVVDTRGRPRLGLAVDVAKNLGFEGVSWDAVHDRLFVVKEKRPLRLFELTGLSAAFAGGVLDLRISEWLPRASSFLPLRDLSSLAYREDSGGMLLLSDESHLVVELDAERQPAALLVLRRGWHGLRATVPQAEGVTVGPRGEVYVISEPNLFYRFDPPGI